MRWQTVDNKSSPALGEKRVIKKFLICPRQIGTEVRWLETAWIEQKYTSASYTDYDPDLNDFYTYERDIWEDISFIEAPLHY